MNSYYEDIESSSQLGVHGPPPRRYYNQGDDDSNGSNSGRTMCSRQALQSCFAQSPQSSNNQSCLYRRFVRADETSKKEAASSTKQALEAAATSTVFLRQYVQNESPPKSSDSEMLTNSKGQKYQTRDAAARPPSLVSSSNVMSDTIVWKNFTIEDTITAISICVAIVFLLSIVSLFIGIFLMYKRKTFVYHPAANNDSGYPHDER